MVPLGLGEARMVPPRFAVLLPAGVFVGSGIMNRSGIIVEAECVSPRHPALNESWLRF